MEFESEVMNAYMQLLVRDFNVKSTDRAMAIDTFEMSNIWKRKQPKVKLDPHMYKYILGIINENHHWKLTVMIPSQKKALLLDPLGESSTDINRCKDVTRAFMRLRGINVSRWGCDTVPHPRQTDSTSCGPFVLKFAECILKGENCKFNTSRKGVGEMRRAIATALLENTDDLTEVCHQCGQTDNPETDEDVQWVRHFCFDKSSFIIYIPLFSIR
ncbi:uncharacterized protein LOC132471262 isoform X1 [Gadus macrocephalus]|uniref:uncharacterized protein LOC132471262 isoform X1 n=1 Tax=Gadus macrocephalus TaxID=80720 RepID=UPI0028CB6630|nr:uncharacterized protein LOC132471262 isoform X1 [Gadus macrocephalus]